MDKKKIIENYVKKHKLPTQSLCPMIIQTWKKSDGTYIYWDSRTNERTTNFDHKIFSRDNLESKRAFLNKHCVSPRSEYTAFYLEYDKKNKMLEIAIICTNGNRGKDGEPKIWKYEGTLLNRYFLFEGDFHPYKIDGTYAFDNDNGKYYNKRFIKEFLRLNNYFSNTSVEEWKKFVGVNGYVSRGQNFDIKYPWHVIESYKQMAKRNVKRNPLLDIELEPIKLDGKEKIIFERIDDKTYVFRYVWFDDSSRRGYSIIDYERLRVFVRNKKPTTVVLGNYWTQYWEQNGDNLEKVWHIVTDLPSNYIKRDYSSRGRSYFINNIDSIKNIEEAYKYDEMKWINEILKDASLGTNDINILDMIVSILRHPIIEALYKAGYPNLAKYVVYKGNIPSILKFIFDIDKEPKTIKDIRLNKFILKELEDLKFKNTGLIALKNDNIVAILNKFFDRETLIHMNEKDIKSWMNFFSQYTFSNIPLLYDPVSYTKYWNKRTWVYSDEDKKLVRKVKGIADRKVETMNNISYYTIVARLYSDMVHLYDRITNKPEIDFLNVIDSYENLERLHNNITNLYNTEEMERRTYYKAETIQLEKKFKDMQEEREKRFNYEDDKYIIKLPKELNEITREGINLHHCVGGYVNSHANGSTNIIFLRKKENEDDSFYTIEVRNNSVIQIHGKHNKWLGNDPDAIPTVFKWIKDRKLNYNEDMLLNLSVGYSPSDKKLDRSILATV